MGFNGNKITEYKDGNTPETGTPALGSTFNAEFNRLYENDNHLKNEIDKLGGVTLDTDTELASNSDIKVPSQHAVKTYVDGQIAGHDAQHDDRYYTETESDARYVKLTGAETVAGLKTFSSIPVLPAADPITVNQATKKGYVDGLDAANVKLTGEQTIAGIKTFSSIPLLPASSPVAVNEAIRKGYVDELISSCLKNSLSRQTLYAGTTSFTPPTGATWVKAILIGGGGGGGGRYYGETYGSGGAGGARLVILFPLSVLNGNYNVTIGLGGNPGWGGDVPSQYATSGGNTYFNQLPDIYAGGGYRGYNNASEVTSPGGIAVCNYLEYLVSKFNAADVIVPLNGSNIPGGIAGGIVDTILGGNGGATAAAAGSNYGGGGAGTHVNNGLAGAGAPGLMILTFF